MQPDLDAIQSAVTESVADMPEVLAVFVHGSRLRGEHRAASDLDLAVLSDPRFSMSTRRVVALAGELTGKLGVQVDAGILRFSNLIYYTQAVGYGRRIFCRDSSLCDALVSRAYSLYARLREDRQEVEAAYHVAR